MSKKEKVEIVNSGTIQNGPDLFNLILCEHSDKRFECEIFTTDPKFCKEYGLGLNCVYEAEGPIERVTHLNTSHKDGRYILEGSVLLLVDNEWGGHHEYFFTALYDSKKGTGKIRMGRKIPTVVTTGHLPVLYIPG
jgi:hypothetical protein